MNKPKTVPFNWELGEETMSLQVGIYYYSDALRITMIDYREEDPELFADMTINIPAYSLEPNESIINGDFSRDILRFIKEQKLGKVRSYQVKSGYGKYSVVAFDLDKLQEFDPDGVAAYKKLRGIL